MLPRILVALFKALAFPFYLLMLCIEEISGEGHWYRKQRRRMESDRPPLPDADFLRLVPVEPGEEPLWLAVRRGCGADRLAGRVALPARPNRRLVADAMARAGSHGPGVPVGANPHDHDQSRRVRCADLLRSGPSRSAQRTLHLM